MQNPSPEPDRILVLARDLFFRAKLEGLVSAAGARPVREEPAALAVIELSGDESVARVASLRKSGIAIIAFASHVQAQLLRAARDAGADAVPNSAVEASLRDWLRERR